MTLSGTTAFGIQTEQQSVIDEAYERVGREASTLSANDVESATRSLSYLFAEWANRGINLWKVEMQSQAITQGQMSFALGSNVIEIFNCYRRTTSGGVTTDTMISPISRAEYSAIPNKQQQSQPTQFYFERTITPSVFLWPTALNASYTIYMSCMLMQNDPGAPTNTLDAPQRYFDAIAAGLAARLAVKWQPDKVALLQGLADRAFDFAAAEDTENVNMRIVPDILGRRFA